VTPAGSAGRLPGADYARALSYATDAHATQLRKGTDTPYIVHPRAVAELVLEHGGSETDAIAAREGDALRRLCVPRSLHGKARRTLRQRGDILGERVELSTILQDAGTGWVTPTETELRRGRTGHLAYDVVDIRVV
jgi:hypothetical protein